MKTRSTLKKVISALVALTVFLTGCNSGSKEDYPKASTTDSSAVQDLSTVPDEKVKVSDSNDLQPTVSDLTFDIMKLTLAHRSVYDTYENVYNISNDHMYGNLYVVREPATTDPQYIVSDMEGNGTWYIALSDKETPEFYYTVSVDQRSKNLFEIQLKKVWHNTAEHETPPPQRFVVDIDGNILCSTDSTYRELGCYENDCFSRVGETSGFDETYRTFELFDWEGNSLLSYDPSGYYGLEYLGDDMFYLEAHKDDTSSATDSKLDPHYNELFSSKTGQWIHYNFPDEVIDYITKYLFAPYRIRFLNGKMAIMIEDKIVAMDAEGNNKIIPYPDGVYYESDGYADWRHSENLITYRYYPVFSAYDVKNESFSTLDVDYIDRIEKYYPINNYVVAEMKGADGKEYFAVFDASLNELISPTLGQPMGIYDEKIFVATSEGNVIYDMNGNLIGNLDKSGLGSGYNIYSDGILMETNSGNTIPVDQTGKPLFDKIDITNAVDISDSLLDMYNEYIETIS